MMYAGDMASEILAELEAHATLFDCTDERSGVLLEVFAEEMGGQACELNREEGGGLLE